ncbi:MAG: type VII secretion protein EssC [Peptococcaceae bacterium]|nr:type VII secretion protein EssC [Peptococcaceae bacterium]
MEQRYKIIISGKAIYQEIEIPVGCEALRIGTGLECDCRLRKENFFEPFELYISKSATGFQMTCSHNIYLAAGDDRKLITKDLRHQDRVAVKYQRFNQELFSLDFMIDFDYETKDYSREIDIADVTAMSIGGTKKCHIAIADEFVGADTIILQRMPHGYMLMDNQSRYGVYVNGAKIDARKQIKDYDFFSLAGYSFYLKGHKLYTAQRKNMAVNGLPKRDLADGSTISYPKFNRNTRTKTVMPTDTIAILDPPQVPEKPKNNLLKSLIPVLGTVALTILMQSVMGGGSRFIIFSLCTMSMGVVTSIITYIGGKREYKKSVARRIEAYSAYIDNKEKDIIRRQDEERELLAGIYYGADRELAMVNSFSADLFDRVAQDEDFLHVRLGTGSLPAHRKIDYKKQEKLEVGDGLSVKPEALWEQYKHIHQVPVVCDFRKANAVGVLGTDEQLYNMLKIILLDIACRHYPTDVRTALMVPEKDSKQFAWIRFLPHIQNEAMNMRNIACDEESRNQVLEFMYKTLSERENTKTMMPHYVVFIYGESSIQNHPLSKYIVKARSLGFTFVFFEHDKELLPQGCDDIIEAVRDHHEGHLICAADSKREGFAYALVSDQDISKAVIKIAPVYCEDISLEGSLTKSISLYELLNIITADDIDLGQRWETSQVQRSMAAPLGVKAKGRVVSLDLHERASGPHGLVAGTTGSGKSEILQSYTLSMATLFHPYEVGFVIIDFKGGGMVNQFKALPHLIGAITNIDGKEIDRSLQSIKAELRKRQRLFAACEVNHIDAYIKKYKTGEVKEPIPHLIIIVDEFAELKAEQPEFMKELISAARIGRSLGVHLILATQKPSGQVNEQIWSNSRFKLCLKVQTKADSNEVLKSPLAAEILEPGRAYLQVGNNEIFELFQSAYSGASVQAERGDGLTEFTLSEVSLSGKRTPVIQQRNAKKAESELTQLNAIVNHVAAYCRKQGIAKLPDICLPPLATSIPCPQSCDLTGKTLSMSVEIGVFDDPANQYQGKAVIDIATQNSIIIGSSQYGKTNLLQTLIRNLASQYDSGELNIYIADFGSMILKSFAGLNHVGGVVVPSEDEKLKNLFKLFNEEIIRRKGKLSEIGLSSYMSYKEAGFTDMPLMMFMIDNFIAFKELYGEYEDDLVNLCREGVSYGMTFVITSPQTQGISYKYMSNFAGRICLYCNQNEYSNVFDRCKMAPENVPGRGLISFGNAIYEYQTYLSFAGDREIDRVEKIKEFIGETNARSPIPAKRIPEIPPLLTYDYLKNNFALETLKPYQVPVGIDYDAVELVTIDLTKALTIGITGKEGGGRTNIARIFMEYLQNHVFDLPVKAYVLDDFEKQLGAFASCGFVDKYSLDITDFDVHIEEIEEELQNRSRQLRDEGAEALRDMPLLICFIQNNAFYSADAVSKEAQEAFKRIIKTYRQLKVCFVFTNIDNNPIPYSAPDMLKMVKDYPYLFHCDDLNTFKLIDINTAALRQYKKRVETGDSYLITEKGVQKQKTLLAEKG